MFVFLLVSVLPASALPDFVPLILPESQRAPTKVETTTKVRASAFRLMADEEPSKLHLGAHVLGGVMSGPLRGGGGAAAHVSYRIPVMERRLSVFVEPGFVVLAGAQPAFEAVAYMFTMPIGMAWQQHLFGPGDARFSAALLLNYVSADADGPQLARTDRFASLGAAAGPGYLLPLGRGSMTFDAQYRAFGYSVANERRIAHAAVLMVGYIYGVL